MKIKQAKEYYDLGVLTGFAAVRDPMTTGWMVVIEGKAGKSWTLETALGAVKSFASLDTLVGEVESITGRVSTLHIGV